MNTEIPIPKQDMSEWFIVWRPSFAGSWRALAAFPSREGAEHYAANPPKHITGDFGSHEIRKQKDGHPLSHWTPTAPALTTNPMTTLHLTAKSGHT